MTLEEADLHSLLPRTATEAAGGWKIRDLWQHSDNGTLAAGSAMTRVVPGADALMFTLGPIA